MQRFEDATSGGAVAPEWGQGRALFGGVVVGAAVRAAAAQVGADRPLRSVLATFVGPLAPGPLAVHARLLRAGRALTTVQVEVAQGDAPGAVVTTAWGADRPSLLSVPGPPLPPELDPAGLLELPYLPGITPQMTQHFDYRVAPEGIPYSGAARPRVAGQVRFKDGAPLDAARVVALADAWPAPVLPLLRAPVPSSTVTWMVNLVAAPPPGGWDGRGLWTFVGDATAAGAGYADVHGHLWAPDGALVATSRQLVVEFSG